MFRLDKKTALITGGGQGIGRAIAEVFARRGATVYILDIDERAAAAACEAIAQEGGTAHFRACDVTDGAAVEATLAAISAEADRLDIVVNNAAIAHIGTAETTTPEDLDRLLNVNVKGVYHVLHAALPRMKAHGGVVLNMASIAAEVGLAERFAYSTTKGAIRTMTFSVAKDYLPFGIRCNCISPARVHTPFVDGYLAQNYPGREQEMYAKLSKTQPIGRMARPEEIAALALYLCSNEAGFVTGGDYPIDGGFLRLNT